MALLLAIILGAERPTELRESIMIMCIAVLTIIIGPGAMSLFPTRLSVSVYYECGKLFPTGAIIKSHHRQTLLLVYQWLIKTLMFKILFFAFNMYATTLYL